MSLVDPGLCIREKHLSGRSDQVYQRLIRHMIEAILDTSDFQYDGALTLHLLDLRCTVPKMG